MPMTAEQALVALRECIASYLEIDPTDLSGTTDIVKDLALDSLDVLEISDAIEARVGRELPLEVFDGSTSLESLADSLSRFLAGAP